MCVFLFQYGSYMHFLFSLQNCCQNFTKMFLGRSIDKKMLIVPESEIRAQWNRYGTRIAFFFLLMAGISQICLGIGLLIPCRSNIEQISCAFSLKAHPCTSLAMPAYIGCLMICIAIFGFGCVGRRASGFLLAIVMSTEIYLGLLLIYTEAAPFTDYFRTSNSDEICDVLQIDTNSFSRCWNNLTEMYPGCGTYWREIQNDCVQGYDHYFSNFNESRDGKDMEPCISNINLAVSSAYTDYRYISGPLMLLNAFICLLFVPLLIFLHSQDPDVMKDAQMLTRIEVIERNKTPIWFPVYKMRARFFLKEFSTWC